MIYAYVCSYGGFTFYEFMEAFNVSDVGEVFRFSIEVVNIVYDPFPIKNKCFLPTLLRETIILRKG